MIRIPSTDRIEVVCKIDRSTAIKVRRILDGRDDPMEIEKVAKYAARCYNAPSALTLQMEAVDVLLDTCGIEAIRSSGQWERYWGDTVALYANTGDSYGGTILYDVERESFYATTWADWVETAERNGRYKFE